MRKLFLSLFVFCFQLLSFGQNNIDVLHYKFNIGLNDVDDTIHGVAEIKVRFLQPSEELQFNLIGPAVNQGKGMKLGKVEGSHIKRVLQPFKTFIIQFSQKFLIGDTATFIIPYSGIPADGLIISKTKYGHRSFFADNWPDRGQNWIPCHDDPADKATVEFIVTAPEHYQVVANGIQIEETALGNGFKTTHWKEDTPISTKVMTIGVAHFAVNLSGIVNNCIPVYSWVYPEDRNNGFKDFSQAKEILEYYISHVGPYGYKKLANVQSRTTFGGLENANTIFYAENSVTGTKANEGLLAHEIAHQWFGNMATEKSFGHVWLSEGFATYFTILYMENKYGKDQSKKMLAEDREQVIQFSKTNDKSVVNTSEKEYMNLLTPNSYQKGGWVLHMLRSELGDSVFWKSIRKYYATYSGGIADTKDLQEIFEQVSGKDLKQFFQQWLYNAGQPELEINWSYIESERSVKIDVKQIQAVKFKFPLSFKINDKIENVYINEKDSFIKIKTDKKPARIMADPNMELLAKFIMKEK